MIKNAYCLREIKDFVYLFVYKLGTGMDIVLDVWDFYIGTS